ncbi:septum formation protein [Idiomarina fontislapidosi]|uniref:dTTP/UTP pyrophosphatase n=1 Tax=Idiomarina fontislapidosi TaxID=263723 RepID=A0A432Y2J4_9GAMM|nr:nucleoside triphosphate pyrophosphatase [Idiomarina fontislapidosi]PYE33334.1 septum formation protein [Idiomarina fontislapidosi]RUO55168.1 hypothetical protein CWE25_07265 [Idiomarina fontislapidosi]|tara:strand:+ start:906 stop:1490 length:585 start_codon:yes stop_codon:yes gene_type:complete
MQLVLASGSPRRRELLSQIRAEFICLASDIPEQQAINETASDYVKRLAYDKALASAKLHDQPCIVIGSDTLIDRDGEVMEKPRNQPHGIAMLRSLAQRKHKVRTAVCVMYYDGVTTDIVSVEEVVTEVTMGEISETAASAYWQTGEPQDKAAGYAIQGGAARWVKRISGSYTAVVGLPLYETDQLLQAVEAKLG